MTRNIVIYIKQNCPYCIKVQMLLDQKGIHYEAIDVVKNPDLFNTIKSEYSIRTVPQIFVMDENGQYIQHINGSDELSKLEADGKLDDMLHIDMYDHSIDITHDTTFYEESGNIDNLI